MANHQRINFHSFLQLRYTIFFDIVKIRWLNYALFLLLIAYSSSLMLKSLSKGVALSWLATLLIINFHIVPHCMQFSCCFYIAIISMIVILKFDKLREDNKGHPENIPVIEITCEVLKFEISKYILKDVNMSFMNFMMEWLR